jgi:hypothetical protein
MTPTSDVRGQSHLLKAQEFLRLLEQQRGGLSSMTLALAQDAAEQAFRAILFARGISRQEDHRPDLKAQECKHLLEDLWSELEPQCGEYSWLWNWRNQARYAHADAPPISEPEITAEMMNRAVACARALTSLAESAVLRA